MFLKLLYDFLEKKFNEGKAIEHSERFLEFWKDSDPGRDEVEDAK